MGFLTAWLVPMVGQKLARPVFFGGLAVILALALFLLGRCTGGDDGSTNQAQQTVRSGDAMSHSASVAIQTYQNRTATDASEDARAAATQEAINHATEIDPIRDAVIAGVCGQAGHRHDPACAVR